MEMKALNINPRDFSAQPFLTTAISLSGERYLETREKKDIPSDCHS